MKDKTKGYFTDLHGERFYKIENYDQMDDFFITVTSSSDVWNFLWSHGGITAGRINCDHSIFPYYTADKISDGKTNTGSYTLLKISKNGKIYKSEPFASLRASSLARSLEGNEIQHNLYKNISGTKVWFEEINNELEIIFRTGWTSSDQFGLVRCVEIENLSSTEISIEALDGCRNILPACVTASFQEERSFLLDAYKKTDYDSESKLALFTVSSIASDKAEPNEGLYTNTCWFSTNDRIYLDPDTPDFFAQDKELPSVSVLKGKRSSCYIDHNTVLGEKNSNNASVKWYQVFDTSLTHAKVCDLKKILSNRSDAVKKLEQNIQEGISLMDKYVSESDGIQETSDEMAAAHHYANVMFNIMRGGIFLDSASIGKDDFLKFVKSRNTKEYDFINSLLMEINSENTVFQKNLEEKIVASGNAQAIRLFQEYMPLTFSRRHGDPSRPWNRFNIRLRDEQDKPILNYEGNWRDIFQNWEALSFSYPKYIKNMVAKFLNAMTAEGYNPYRISRDGLDWEIPDPANPWAQIGYWGDHQVIYVEKLLELWSKTNKQELLASLDKAYYSTSKVPFIVRPYNEIKENPRHSIIFDKALSDELIEKSKTYGSDAKLIRDQNDNVVLLTLTAKLLQIVINKACNFVPGGGIWLNTQRPEWNDANNALAGYGLSMVTVCYLRRFISFLIDLYGSDELAAKSFDLPLEIAACFASISKLYSENECISVCTDSKARNNFVESAGLIFQKEYEKIYKSGYSDKQVSITSETICSNLKEILNHIDHTIKLNKREDGLYHSYNTLIIKKDSMDVQSLQEMLEGQVAVLSSGFLSDKETCELVKALKKSAMFEPHQYSYMLYPNKELPDFEDKNCISESFIQKIKDLINRSENKILIKDSANYYHFNADFVNANTMKKILSELPENEKPTDAEFEEVLALYEKTFNHQSFTGRSGTFYAFEGLGSIYWHMVAKLLLAVQERALNAKEYQKELADAYYDIRKGIGYNKSPEIYGAFPSDPYSHTPNLQGAKQPGMTGQVKEEILTRWGELGVSVENGIASFKPRILQKSEFNIKGKLSFTWCGTPVLYILGNENKISVTEKGKENCSEGCKLTVEQTEKLFARDGSISKICVTMNLSENLM
ncbi:MAG: hypothetical protein MJ182_02500 [Treponema sp.]|nr:hypothetical protein [Treponema sp.]